jgi:hypothetical protein
MNQKAIGPVRDSEKARLKLPRRMKAKKRQSFLSRRFLFGRQKHIDICFERICQNEQFGVRYTAKLRLNFRQCCAAQVPPLNRTARGKHFLCQSLLIAQFSDLRSDNILWFGHAPKMELDTKTIPSLNCTNFGATWQRSKIKKPKENPL